MSTTDDARPAVGAGTTAQLRRALRELETEVARRMRINLDPAGLSVDDWAVLCLLADGEGHPMSEVVATLGIPAASVTRLVDRLVGDALLHRAVAPGDRRKVLVVLAPHGRELYDRLAAGQEQLAELLAVRVGEGGLGGLTAQLVGVVEALRGA
ncbi:MAG: MarR family transcriptional regulator [Nocardioides sp.]|nr:MarR family transcriptional regulator [Nocardioides sp.]